MRQAPLGGFGVISSVNYFGPPPSACNLPEFNLTLSRGGKSANPGMAHFAGMRNSPRSRICLMRVDSDWKAGKSTPFLKHLRSDNLFWDPRQWHLPACLDCKGKVRFGNRKRRNYRDLWEMVDMLDALGMLVTWAC